MFGIEGESFEVCREAGGRVVTNMFVRDMDLAGVNALGSQRCGRVDPVAGCITGSGHRAATVRPEGEQPTTTDKRWMCSEEERRHASRAHR